MNIRETIKEQVNNGCEPLDIIRNICDMFRQKCLDILKEELRFEQNLLQHIEDGSTATFIRPFIDTKEKNDNAVIGIYLAEELRIILNIITEEMIIKRVERKAAVPKRSDRLHRSVWKR